MTTVAPLRSTSSFCAAAVMPVSASARKSAPDALQVNVRFIDYLTTFSAACSGRLSDEPPTITLTVSGSTTKLLLLSCQ